MGAVAVAQNLHAMVAVFNNNNVTRGIECDAHRQFESAGAISFAADGADMGAVAVAQHLHAMVVTVVKNSNVALAVDGDAPGRVELSVA